MAQYTNPNQEPDTARRLMLAFAVVVIVLMGTQYFMRKDQPAQPANPPQQPAGQSNAAAGQPAPSQGATAQTSATPPGRSIRSAPKAAPAPAQIKKADAEQELVIESDLYRLTFTNKGALVKSWVLKKHTNEKGQPLDLVLGSAASQHGYPLSFFTYEEQLTQKLNSALYVANQSGTVQAPQSLTFEYSDGEVVAQKKLTFDKDSYEVRIETSVQRGGSYATALPSWPAGFGDQVYPHSFSNQFAVVYSNGSLTKVEGKKVSGGNTVKEDFAWGGVEDHYFAAIFLPAEPAQADLVQLHYPFQVGKNPAKPDPNSMEKVSVLGAAAGAIGGPTNLRLFAGPKEVDTLKRVHASAVNGQPGPTLSPLVDFGWFDFFARPLFAWLKWTQQHWLPNWGLTIVLVTVIINVVLLPLRIASSRSMMKMAKLQPQMKAIQDRFKGMQWNDPRRQKQQQEVSALYKQHGVNPAMGCVPIVLQIPFLIAFYNVLANAIELRNAPFLWLTDLSAPDPWYVIPALFVLSMIALQRMTPQVGMDPVQQKMMQVMMPMMVGIFTALAASGLGLYWFVGNMVAIVQQKIMNNSKLGREMREAMEKRAARKR